LEEPKDDIPHNCRSRYTSASVKPFVPVAQLKIID